MTSSLRKTLGIACIAISMGPIGAYAGVISGFGSPSTAIPGGTVETFSSANGFSGTSLTLGDLTLSGTSFSGAASLFNVNTTYAGNYNTSGASVNSPSGYPEVWRFDFATPVDAFAFNLGAHDISWTVSGYTASNTLVDSLSFGAIHSSNAGEYYGISGSNIAYGLLTAATGGNRDYVLIDNVTYRTSGSVPEPATLALMGFGLAGISWKRRKAT